jgi:hypothetical protein
MPFDDLDLEFEDEDEAKKKKNDAVHQDVDLEFQAPEGARRPPSQPVARAAAPGSNPAGAPRPVARPQGAPNNVQKLDDARAIAPSRPAGSPMRPAGAPQPRVQGSSALKEESSYDLESEEVVQMREQMKKVQFDADVRVQVAEFKTEILGELLGDMKVMEHQIGQLLVRINAKHPDMKQEALMIKKILADFTAKKRK